MVFSTSSNFFDCDINSLELVSLFVKDYKNLKDIFINLNPKYETIFSQDTKELQINTVGYFPAKEEYSNIKLICGENGVGKSSILELIRNPGRAKETILVMKDKNNVFISSEKIKIIYNNEKYTCNVSNNEIKFSALSIDDSFLYEDHLSFTRNFVGFYVQEKHLFDDIDNNLISHFEISYWNSEEMYSEILSGIRNNLKISEIESIHLDELREKDILSFIFYVNFGDSTFTDWVDAHDEFISYIKKDINTINIVDKLIFISEKFYSLPDKSEIMSLINKLSSMTHKEYRISKYEEISTKFYKINNELINLMKTVYENAHVHLYEDMLLSAFYFRGYKKIGNSKRYLHLLSAGELYSIRIRYYLFIKMSQRDCALILEDEPDLHLHPEWARCFLKNFIAAIVHIRKYLSQKDETFAYKTYNFVITTHSPLILSDFFNEEVVFFRRIDHDNRVKVANFTSNCFAGNVGDILIDNFFLSKTIGAFSEEQLKEIIQKLNSAGTDSTKTDEQLTEEDKCKIRFLISRIGDKLLRKLLEEKCRRCIN